MEWYWLYNAEALFEKSTPIVILFTANPTRNAVVLHADLHYKKLANCLRGGTREGNKATDRIFARTVICLWENTFGRKCRNLPHNMKAEILSPRSQQLIHGLCAEQIDSDW
jgi:hypothetical protein